MGRKHKKKYLPEQVIIAVMSGDRVAMERVLLHYDWFIGYMLDMLIRSHHLNRDLIPIDDMKQEIRMELFKSLKTFK